MNAILTLTMFTLFLQLVLLEKLIISQLIKNCSEFYGTGVYYRIYKD